MVVVVEVEPGDVFPEPHEASVDVDGGLPHPFPGHGEPLVPAVRAVTMVVAPLEELVREGESHDCDKLVTNSNISHFLSPVIKREKRNAETLASLLNISNDNLEYLYIY